jgi:hypothetical protein
MLRLNRIVKVGVPNRLTDSSLEIAMVSKEDGTLS